MWVHCAHIDTLPISCTSYASMPTCAYLNTRLLCTSTACVLQVYRSKDQAVCQLPQKCVRGFPIRGAHAVRTFGPFSRK